VFVPVAVDVDVAVPVAVEVGVEVDGRVGVEVSVGVRVGVAVGVCVRVGVAVNVGPTPVMMISPSRITVGMNSPRLFRTCTLVRKISDLPGATAENVMMAISSLPLNAEPSNACS
jgi:hypothetical protein